MAKEKKDLKKIKREKFVKENLALIIILAIIIGLGLIVMLVAIDNSEEEKNKVYGDDVITMHYFHLTTCPHCQRFDEYLPELEGKYPNLKVEKYEMTQSSSAQTYRRMANETQGLDPNQFPGTPLIIIGEEFNVGFGTPESTGPIIESLIQTEQEKINENWNESTMTRTIDIRKEQLQNE